MKKRIFCAVMTVVLVMTMLPVIVAADGAVKLAFTQRETKAGATQVQVGVDMSNNPGLVTATIPVTWDNDVLHLVNVIPSEDILSAGWIGMGMDEYESNGTYYLAWDNDLAEEDFTTEVGCLAELVFDIVDPSKDTNTTLAFDMDDPIANVMNFEMEDLRETVTVNAVNGLVGVTAAADGDDPVVSDGAQFVFSEIKGKPGDTVDVTIDLVNNPGISSAKLVVEFDNSALTLNQITVNTAELGGMATVSKTLTSPVTINWFNGLEDIAGDVNYATLNFTISDQIQEESNFEITATFNPNDVCDVNEENVAFVVTPGNIKVIIYIPGDINADESVNNKDLIRLLQYLTYGDEVVVDGNATDVNGDGAVNNKDLIRLMQYLTYGDEVEIH